MIDYEIGEGREISNFLINQMFKIAVDKYVHIIPCIKRVYFTVVNIICTNYSQFHVDKGWVYFNIIPCYDGRG